ncbi:MITOGEN-ACTIVATED PROTEIN KINASE KINASE KINASE YODA [Salix viminalis]|uniref:mitogen-activated protein kinase kinase kinase n=1 Tax=Salix viminalis TaxID=40686 RepID=A0A9Q0NTR0_SALVM|nr:MITOGEN-ACTIVATED PROTEIN KINASE KINASE KINASE YODA [Salix viminalis]
MHFFSKTPSSSSMPSSPSVFSTNTNTNTNNCSSTAGNSWIARGQSFMIKKLERQRKPRHVSEQDLGSNLTDRPKSPSGDPDSAKKSRSPRGMDHWSSVAVPHPLPVPESLLTRRQEPLGSILGHGHLGSPEEGLNHVLRRNSTDQIATKVAKPSSNFRQRFSQHANVNSSRDLRLKIQARSAPTSGFSSPSASPQRSNSANPFDSHVANKLTKYSGNSNRVPSHDLNIEGANYKSSSISSPRSAPISGLPSPATVSPRRSYTGEFLPSFVASQESQVRPTLNIPDLGRLASHSSQVPPVKTVLSPDHSPLRSPRLQSPCVDLENKCYSRSRRKLLQGSSKEWPENSCVSAHPRSAPISGLPSPATVSPRRSHTGDFLPSFVASQESQVRPTLKIPDLGRLASHSSQVSPVKTVLSPDHSPLRSPRLQSPCVDLENKCYSRSRRKLLQGSSKEWPENSRVSAHPFPLPRSPLPHPLPLPPGAAPLQSSMPSPPTSIHNTLEKRNEPLRKNQWVKGKLIGCGSYGRVYRGTNRVTGASCAMKEVDIIPGDPKSAESVKQLEQEIRVLRDLKHPNIVQYYGCEIVDEQFYIFLEYINPGSINKYVQEHCGHLPESIVRNFTRHILSGLAYLHSKKTVHRDIKGANLLVDASGVVKLTDFGTAKHLTGLSYELSLKGSPHWMAPEVIKAVMLKSDNPELALAVDTWSLGCTIIEMVTGKPPWGDLQGAQAMFKILNKDPPIPENLSPEGKDFLRCCFRRNPAERPSAMMLLDHPFVCKSNDLNVSACREEVPAVNPVVSIKY